MSETAQKSTVAPQVIHAPVMPGMVLSHFMGEVRELYREVTARRVLADDLAEFFAQNPEVEDAFAGFQQKRETARRKARAKNKNASAGRKR